MQLQAVLFDNDGTLVDTHDLILSSMRYSTCKVLGRTIPDEQLMARIGIPLKIQLRDLAGDDELGRELLHVYREHNHAHHDAAVHLFPGVLDGLKALAEAGLRLGVVTSKRAELATRGLQITGVWEYFDCLVGPDDAPKAKPEPDPILLGADILGVPAEACAYVGDSPFDIHAANAAGCPSVAALWGMFSESVLRAENPDYAFETFSEFVDWALS